MASRGLVSKYIPIYLGLSLRLVEAKQEMTCSARGRHRIRAGLIGCMYSHIDITD